MEEGNKEVTYQLSTQDVQEQERKGVLGKQKNSRKGTKGGKQGLQPARTTDYIKAST